MKIGLLAVVVIALRTAEAGAHARPVEMAPARSVAPAPNVSRRVRVLPQTITNRPTAVVSNPPPAVVQGSKARPRKCWCYLVNPVPIRDNGLRERSAVAKAVSSMIAASRVH